MKYPNPCDTCTKSHCTQFNCPDLRKRVNTIWKQFNGYPSRAYRAQKRTTNKKFVYEHPDIIRQYLVNGPCTQCQRAKVCDTPCSAYWRWWDARMEWFRRRFGG